MIFSSVLTRDDGTTSELCCRVDPKQALSGLSNLSTFKKLKPTTSLGPDNISNVLLKKCANALSVPLAHISDTSFTVGKLPVSNLSSKKDALTTPVIINLYL